MAGRAGIIIHTEEDFIGLREAGRLAAETLDMITDYVRPGVTTGELTGSFMNTRWPMVPCRGR